MRFTSAISTAIDLDEACQEVADRLSTALAGDPIDLCVAFVSARFPDKERTAALLHGLLAPRHLVGCSGGGIIGGGREIEGRAALSVTVASLPGVEVRPVSLHEGDLPSEDAAPSAWIEMIGMPAERAAGFIVLPDPFTFPVDRLLAGLDFAYPEAPKVGGLASGAQQPGGHVLFCGTADHHSGAVVLALSGDIVVETRVAQGCKPFGAVGRITKARQHDLLEVDGMTAVQFLQRQLSMLEGRELELATNKPLFLGIAMDPFAVAKPAHGDFLVRNVIGYDPAAESLAIGELLSVGRRVQFHLRDRETSSQDLRDVLASGDKEAGQPRGALLFSCLGRGVHLYGEEGHDSRIFEEVVGPVSLGGFFCNGEIGPVHGTTHLHGYTSSFALFAETRS